MNPARQRSHVLQAGVAIMALFFTAGVVRSVLEPAGEKVLRAHLGTLRSATSEALVLIEQNRSGRLTDSYVREEADLLAHDLSKAGSALAGAATKPELKPLFQEAAMLAARAASALAPLIRPTPAADGGLAARALLAQIRARAQALEAGLEKP